MVLSPVWTQHLCHRVWPRSARGREVTCFRCLSAATARALREWMRSTSSCLLSRASSRLCSRMSFSACGKERSVSPRPQPPHRPALRGGGSPSDRPENRWLLQGSRGRRKVLEAGVSRDRTSPQPFQLPLRRGRSGRTFRGGPSATRSRPPLGSLPRRGVVMALDPGCVTVPSTQWVFLKTCSAHRS